MIAPSFKEPNLNAEYCWTKNIVCFPVRPSLKNTEFRSGRSRSINDRFPKPATATLGTEPT